MSGDPDILGTYDLEARVEDCVILLETTHKNYGDPQRAVLIEQGLKELIETKVKYNKADRFALVTFAEESEIVMNFEDFNVPGILQALEGATNLGRDAYLIQGLSRAFQVTIESMQKLIEGKQFRILIVGEGTWPEEKKEELAKLDEMLNISSKVGIFIDAIQINPFSKSTLLKHIAKETNGGYIECSPSEFGSYVGSFASHKKIVEESMTKEDRDLKGLLEIIARPVVTLEEEITMPSQLLEMITSEDQKYMCGVCYDDECMICKGPAFACGAFCPSCEQFYHSHCCSGWAENSEDTPSNVFKCPKCWHLLKVSGSVHRVNVLKEEFKLIYKVSDEKFAMEQTTIKNIAKDWEHKTCVFCHGIFETENSEVLICQKCGAIYHQECMDQVDDVHGGRCRACDIILRRRYGASKGIQRIV